MRLSTLLFILIFSIGSALQGQVYCFKHQNAGEHLSEVNALRRGAEDKYNYDILYHRLELRASPEVFWLTGAVTSYFKFTKGANKIAFDLRNHLKVDSVKQRGVNLSFTHIADIVTVQFPVFYSKNFIDSVTVYYSGNPTQGKYRSYFIEGHVSGKVLATLSEPYGAPDWWPCKQDLTDKFDSCDIWVTTDSGYLCGGPGLLQSTQIVEDTMVQFHWKHRYPSNFYLIALAISNYRVIEDSVLLRGKQLPILNYVYPQSAVPSESLIKATGPILKVLDSVFGPYPYLDEKYGHMQWNVNGGMEHATMSSMGAYNFDLVAHEAAHQWFGDKVTCSSWQDIWINESFATYLNGLVYEFMFGKDSFNFEMGKVLDRAKRENDLSVFVEDTSSVGRIFNQNLSYQKGAMVLHSLRFYIGDTAFFNACRNFLADPLLAYGDASTADLIRHLKLETSKDVDAFMTSYYYGKGYPNYLVRWIHEAGRLELKITQSQSNTSTSFFKHSIPIHVFTDTGTLLLNIDINQPFTELSIPISLGVSNVEFNINNQVLATGTSVKIESEGDSKVLVFPNPSDKNITIKSNKNVLVNVYIYNAVGKLVFTQHDINQYKTELGLGNMSKGNYILQIETENETYIKRYAKK